MRITTLLLLAASSVALFASSPASHAACDPTVIQSPTKFPLQSQLRGQKGVVFLEVTVDESGRVAATRLLRSSGHKRLDRAATASIRAEWVFDVTSCQRKDLPANDLIAVEYRNDEYAD
jgi:TonB family protein